MNPQWLPSEILVFEKPLGNNKIFRLIYRPLLDDFVYAFFDNKGVLMGGANHSGSHPVYSWLYSCLTEGAGMREATTEEITLGAIKIREGFRMVTEEYRRAEMIAESMVSRS